MRSLALGVALLLLLAGCPDGAQRGNPSNVDNERLAVMQRETVFKHAVGQSYAEPGFRPSDKFAPRRSKVTATLADYAEPEVARKNGAQAMATLRDSGWTVFHARCDRFSYVANAFKVVDGVSYYAQLDGAIREVLVSVVLQMRAPHSSEPTSDLFADRPPALKAGESCLETNTTGVADGVEIVLDERGPEPDGTPKAKGHR